MEWAEVLPDLLTALAALLASGAAVVGLWTWRRQLRGTVEYDVARKTLRGALAVRDAITNARRPVMSGHEWTNRPGRDPSLLTVGPDDWAYAMQNRWNLVANAVSEIEADSLHAEVLWGDEVADPLRSLRDLASRLYAGIAFNVHLREHPDDSEVEIRHANRALVFAVGGREGDVFQEEIDTCLQSLRSVLRKHIRR